ncbi:hypothetical protein [Pseudomonas sp. 65/3-MNA-CIBAN-0223]|uniref:hypothetical protein n=1 Tax=Pseudomonas sp. 65/3-MNA-CIBAN-0223 TaxID=3140476 RepID=UPI00331EF64C
MNFSSLNCTGSRTVVPPYTVDIKRVKALEQELAAATNIETPFFIILGYKLDAANQQFNAKGEALLKVKDNIANLLNFARMGCPGTSEAEALERMSKEVAGEIKKNEEMKASQNRKIEGDVARA